MIYPAINELVEKTGNRYNLVIAAAKRARTISKDEMIEERQEMSGIDGRIKERSDRLKKDGKVEEKPITQALDEIINDEIYITAADEADAIALPSENDIIEDFDATSYSTKIIDDDISFNEEISESDLKELMEGSFAGTVEEDFEKHGLSEENIDI